MLNRKGPGNKRVILFHGKLVYLADLAKHYGVCYCTLLERMRRGYDIETAVELPKNLRHYQPKWVNYHNSNRELHKLCESKGLKYSTVYNRIFLRGWDVDRAIDQPIKNKRPHK